MSPASVPDSGRTSTAPGGSVGMVARVNYRREGAGDLRDGSGGHALGDGLDETRSNGVLADVLIAALLAVRTGTRAGLKVDLVGIPALAVNLVETIGDPIDGHGLGDGPLEAAALDRWSRDSAGGRTIDTAFRSATCFQHGSLIPQRSHVRACQRAGIPFIAEQDAPRDVPPLSYT